MLTSIIGLPAIYSLSQGFYTAMTPQYALYLEGRYMSTFSDKGSAERYARIHHALQGE